MRIGRSRDQTAKPEKPSHSVGCGCKLYALHAVVLFVLHLHHKYHIETSICKYATRSVRFYLVTALS